MLTDLVLRCSCFGKIHSHDEKVRTCLARPSIDIKKSLTQGPHVEHHVIDETMQHHVRPHAPQTSREGCSLSATML